MPAWATDGAAACLRGAASATEEFYGPHPRSRSILFGGCLFWLFVGVFWMFFQMLKAGAWALIVGSLLALAALLLLAGLCWWPVEAIRR